MSEDKVTEKKTAKGLLSPKAKKGLSLTWKGVVGLSIPAMITAFITMVPEIVQDVREQRKAQQAGYKTLSPAVNDLQEDVERLRVWGQGVASAHGKLHRTIRRLKKKNWKLEQRIYQIELALQARRIRVLPVSSEDPNGASDQTSKADKPSLTPVPKARPKRHVPKDLKGASAYQKQRVQMNCPPGDPACGKK